MNYFLESQAWWNTTGLSLNPNNLIVGRHIHIGTDIPLLQAVNNLTLNLKLTFHDQPSDAKLVTIRVMNAAGDRLFLKKTNLPLIQNDVPIFVLANLNLTGLRGWQELRISAMVNYANGDTQFQSTSWYVYIGSEVFGFPSKDLMGKGWYTKHGYARARISPNSFPLLPVMGIWRPRVKATPESSQHPIKEHMITINPNFHNNYAGQVVKYGFGMFDGNVNIDTTQLINGLHKLVILSSDGFNAGVLVVPFVVNN